MVKKESGITSFDQRLKLFSMQYLAHHPLCIKFKNHVFVVGSLFLCVGCTSVLLGFISFTILFFVLQDIFLLRPLVVALVTTAGVIIALIQLILKPNNKWIKAFFRLSLGIGLGSFTGLIVLTPHWGLKIGLFFFLFPGVYLYNKLRGPSPYEECNKCSIKFTEPTCDLNFYTK